MRRMMPRSDLVQLWIGQQLGIGQGAPHGNSRRIIRGPHNFGHNRARR